MVRPAGYACRIGGRLSGWVLCRSVQQNAATCYAYTFPQRVPTIGDSYSLTQSGAEHSHPITNPYPSLSYHYPSSYTDSGGEMGFCEGNA